MEKLASAQHEQNWFANAVSLWQAAVGRTQALKVQSLESHKLMELSQCSETWHGLSSRLDSMERRCWLNCLGNAFDTWLMEAKIRALRQRCNRRLLVKTFRDWRLIQKMKTFQMERDRALMGRTFEQLLRHYRETALDERETHLRSMAITVSRFTIARHYSSWREAARHTQNQEQMANEDRDEVVKIGFLNAWFDASMRDAEADRWARRGEFYLTVERDFALWKSWSKAEKERKLREVYAQAKHITNSRLVLHCWRGWRYQNDATAAVVERADDEWRRKESEVKAATLDLWFTAVGHNQRVELNCQHHISESLFSHWSSIATDLALWDEEAWEVWAERMADSCWKRWNIAFQWVEGQEYNASKAAERRRAKSTHEAFILWRELASADVVGYGSLGTIGHVRRATNVDSFSRSEASWPAGRQPLAKPRAWTRSNMSEYIPDAERQTARGQAADGESVAGVSPVSTPTRWTGRMRAVMGLPSTTPVAALPTPYERELRARYGTETTPPESLGREGPSQAGLREGE
jgi:hypothetical protein